MARLAVAVIDAADNLMNIVEGTCRPEDITKLNAASGVDRECDALLDNKDAANAQGADLLRVINYHQRYVPSQMSTTAMLAAGLAAATSFTGAVVLLYCVNKVRGGIDLRNSETPPTNCYEFVHAPNGTVVDRPLTTSAFGCTSSWDMMLLNGAVVLISISVS